MVWAVTTDLILARDATSIADLPPLPTACSIIHITDINDENFSALEQFCENQHFPAGWARQMIMQSAEATLLRVNAVPAAAGWLTRKPFYVSEIQRTFSASDNGDYYFGDWVAPPFRGQHLQRALIAARLHRSSLAHRHWALTMTRAAIPISLANYRTCGFEISAQWQSTKILTWHRARQQIIRPQLPAGTISR
jgi:hypothetical protein